MFHWLEGWKAGLRAKAFFAARHIYFCSSMVYKRPLPSQTKHRDVRLRTELFTGAGVSDSERFGQFDIYFPIAIGFQILALPGFVRLADIFSYAQSKGE